MAIPIVIAEMRDDTAEPYCKWGSQIPFVTKSNHPRFTPGTRFDYGFLKVALEEGYTVTIKGKRKERHD